MRGQPSNSILVQDDGSLRTEEKVIEVATNMYPGRLVQQGTDDNDIVVGAENAKIIGVLGYEHTQGHYRPSTRTTIYTVNSRAIILRGVGTIVLLRLASGENITALGTKLVPTAAGMVKAATQLNVPSGTTAVTSEDADPDIEGEVPDNPPVAEAMEIVDASGADAFIMAKLLF